MNEIPPLKTLIFYATRECNLRCRHCWQQAIYRQEDPGVKNEPAMILPGDFRRILNELIPLGLTCVKFSGGEPFLHNQLLEFIRIADRKGMALLLETNATLISDEIARELGNVEHLHVAVSLDGSTADIHDYVRGVPGSFRRTVNSLERLRQNNISFQIIMCLLRVNREDISEMAILAETFGAERLKVNPVLPMGRGVRLRESGDFLTIQELLAAQQDCLRSLPPRFDGVVDFAVPMAFRPFRKINAEICSVCGIFNILGMMSNGDLSFCGIGNIEPELVIGNIFKDAVHPLWEKAPLFQEMRRKLPAGLKGICSRCIFHGVCIGECRAMAYHQTHDLMAPYWMCQEAYEAGLFPTTRMLPAVRPSES